MLQGVLGGDPEATDIIGYRFRENGAFAPLQPSCATGIPPEVYQVVGTYIRYVLRLQQ